MSNLVFGLLKASEDTHVDVLTLRKPGAGYKKDPKGRVVEWKLPRGSVPEFSGRRVIFNRLVEFAFKHWHEIAPDLIHVHDFDSLQIGWFLRTAFSTPLVLTVHRAPTEWRTRRYQENVKDCFMEAVRRHGFVDRIVVPSEASKSVLLDQGFEVIEVIPHGISDRLLLFGSNSTVLRKLNIPDDTVVILCPCRADEHKGLLVFIEGAAELRRSTCKRVLFIVTSGPEAQTEETTEAKATRDHAASYGLKEGEDILFVSPFEYGVPLATIYRRTDIVVVPSLRESFGQNVLDAFMFRKPVVANNSMALKEIVRHGENGLLFNTAKELAWQLEQLIDDKDLVSRVVDGASRSLAEHYSVDVMAGEYLRLYNAIIHESKT